MQSLIMKKSYTYRIIVVVTLPDFCPKQKSIDLDAVTENTF